MIEVLYNWPQYEFLLVRAVLTIILWARGTGKTSGPVTGFIYSNASEMPRSLGGWVVPTYEKILTQMIPNFKKALAQMGLVEGVHYKIGKFFDEKTGVKRPYTCPDKATYFVHFANGSGFVFISLDRASTMGNGLDLDWLIIDEAKLCIYDKVKEVMLAVRGNKQHFGHLSCHHSILIASDKPTNSKGKWLYDYQKEVNPELIQLIIETAVYVEKLKLQLENSNSTANKANLKSKIKRWESYLNQLRKQAVHVSEASTFENVMNVGLDYIKMQKKLLTDIDFKVSVANKTVLGGTNDFYPLLDEDKHGYLSSNFDHLDSLELSKGYSKDCRWDSDIIHTRALDIAFDHNNAINWLVVGQENREKEYAQVNSFYVLKPQYIDDLVDKFCKYYEQFKLKKVNYYYNHTSKAQNASGDMTFAERIKKRFKHNKWEVVDKYYGKEPSHTIKYEFWLEMLKGGNEKLMPFRFNINNNEDWYISMKSAKSRQGKEGFEKDKSSERDETIPAQHATHGTEATDCLLIGRFRSKIKQVQSQYVDYTNPDLSGNSA